MFVFWLCVCALHCTLGEGQKCYMITDRPSCCLMYPDLPTTIVVDAYLFVFLLTIFVLMTSKNAMKQMILSFKMKSDVISDLFLMQWFQKDSLDTVGLEDLRRGSGVIKTKSDIRSPKCAWGLGSLVKD